MARKSNENMETLENAQSNTTAEKYKTEKCNVLSYNEKTKELDIDFRGSGIRLKNVENIRSDFVSVKYSGEIGSPDFYCKL